MIRALALAAAMAMLAGCGGTPVLSVDKYRMQCETLKGKAVRVAGYLGECAGYECHLASDPTQINTFDPPWIGIGGDEAFDHKAASFQNSYVVISGIVARDTCTGAGGTDRSAGIEPTDIRAWTVSEGAPKNSN